jgi:CIC family chloride channel protein
VPRLDSLLLVVIALGTGALAGYGALAFLLLVHAVQYLFYGYGHEALYVAVAKLPWWQVLLAPAVGGLIVGLMVRFFVPGRCHYSPADVIEAVHENDGRMSLQVGLASAAASAFSIGAGASVGRYGPIVHLGASLASWLAQTLRLNRAHRLAMVGCGAAAAVAASFNAPLAGVLFVQEAVLGAFALRSFVPITIAAVVGALIARLHGQAFPLYGIPEYQVEFAYEYPLFAVVGLCGGLLAVAFMRSMELGKRLVAGTRVPLWLRPMIGGLLVGLLAIQFPQVIGLGEGTIADALRQLFPLWLMVALVVVKMLATSASFAFGFSGGVFAPALFLGAMMGGALGSALGDLLPLGFSSPPVYLVAGMGAVLSCVIGAPLATIILVFELTRDYSLTTAVMVAVVSASMVSRRLFGRSYFVAQLEQRGVDLRAGREVHILRSRTLSEVISSEYLALGAQRSVAQARLALLETSNQDVFVVGENQRLLGRASLFDLARAEQQGLAKKPVGEVATLPKRILEMSTDLHEAMQMLPEFVGISLPVVADRQGMQLVGIIHESHLIAAYDAAVEQARSEERGDA